MKAEMFLDLTILKAFRTIKNPGWMWRSLCVYLFMSGINFASSIDSFGLYNPKNSIGEVCYFYCR